MALLISNTNPFLDTVRTTNLIPSVMNPIARGFDFTPKHTYSLMSENPFLNTVMTTNLNPSAKNKVGENFDFTPRHTNSVSEHPLERSFLPSLFDPCSTNSVLSNPVNSEPDIQKQTHDLLIQVFKKIPINGDLKAKKAILALKKIQQDNLMHYKDMPVDSALLKESICFLRNSKFAKPAKKILAEAYLELSNQQKMSQNQIASYLCIEFLLGTLYLLSSNQSIPFESRDFFSLLHDVFNQLIFQANRILEKIVATKDFSEAVNTTCAAIALLRLSDSETTQASARRKVGCGQRDTTRLPKIHKKNKTKKSSQKAKDLKLAQYFINFKR